MSRSLNDVFYKIASCRLSLPTKWADIELMTGGMIGLTFAICINDLCKSAHVAERNYCIKLLTKPTIKGDELWKLRFIEVSHIRFLQQKLVFKSYSVVAVKAIILPFLVSLLHKNICNTMIIGLRIPNDSSLYVITLP